MSGKHAPAALPPEKEPRDLLDMRLGGPQSLSGRYGEEKNLTRAGNLNTVVIIITTYFIT
jgi:hypothetical protein